MPAGCRSRPSASTTSRLTCGSASFSASTSSGMAAGASRASAVKVSARRPGSLQHLDQRTQRRPRWQGRCRLATSRSARRAARVTSRIGVGRRRPRQRRLDRLRLHRGCRAPRQPRPGVAASSDRRASRSTSTDRIRPRCAECPNRRQSAFALFRGQRRKHRDRAPRRRSRRPRRWPRR